MEEFKRISIRGRMAYLLCLFEKLLIRFGCKYEEWNWIMDKLWQFTEVEYVDDWMYEIAELLPECILEDQPEAFEYLSKEEYNKLKHIYSNINDEINRMMIIIFELGTVEIYSKVLDYSPDTLEKLQEAFEIMKDNKIELIEIKPFKQYPFVEGDGWGECFSGKELSMFKV